MSSDPLRYRRYSGSLIEHSSIEVSDGRFDCVSRIIAGRQDNDIKSEHHTLLVNLRGAAVSGQDFVNGSEVPFEARKPGAITFLPRGYHLTGWDVGQARASFLSFRFCDDNLPELVGEQVPLDRFSPRLAFTEDRIFSIALSISREMREARNGGHIVVENYASVLIVELIRHLERRRSPVHGLPEGLCLQLTAFINENIDQALPVTALADLAGLSPAQFNRLFRLAFGHSPHQYILERRLHLSRQKVLNSNASITDIAHSCGFSSSSHMSFAYKRRFGVAPSRDRYS